MSALGHSWHGAGGRPARLAPPFGTVLKSMRNVTIWSDDSNAARAIFRKQRTGEVSVDYGVHLGRPRWKGKPDDRAARRAETAERKPRHRDRAVDRGRTQQIGRAHVRTPVT